MLPSSKRFILAKKEPVSRMQPVVECSPLTKSLFFVQTLSQMRFLASPIHGVCCNLQPNYQCSHVLAVHSVVPCSGRLPYTVYDESWATSRLEDGSYRHNMLDHDVADTQSTYRYLNPEETPVLFPFGFGLSLSRFELALSQEPGTAIHTDGSDSTNITVSASNAGSVDGDVVVQVYMQPPAEYLEYLHNITTVHAQNSDIKGPRRALIAYSRLSDIVAGQDASTVFQLDASDFLMANTAGDLVSAPGNYTITVETGSSKDDPKQVQQ